MPTLEAVAALPARPFKPGYTETTPPQTMPLRTAYTAAWMRFSI
jgi:hypothetical protein